MSNKRITVLTEPVRRNHVQHVEIDRERRVGDGEGARPVEPDVARQSEFFRSERQQGGRFERLHAATPTFRLLVRLFQASITPTANQLTGRVVERLRATEQGAEAHAPRNRTRPIVSTSITITRTSHPQRFHRIDSCGAPCRNKRGQERDDDEHASAAPTNAAGSVVLTWNRKLSSTRVTANGGRQAARDSKQRQAERLPQHHAEHGSLSGTKRATNADLLSTLRDRVRERSVEANQREEECRARERPKQLRSEVLPSDRAIEYLVHRADVGDRLIRVNLQHGLTNSPCRQRRVAVRTNSQVRGLRRIHARWEYRTAPTCLRLGRSDGHRRPRQRSRKDRFR